MIVDRFTSRILRFSGRFYPIRCDKRTAINLSYKIIGAVEHSMPIFILHGLLGSKKHWKGLAKTIMNLTQNTVVTVDLRNHGNSPFDSSHRYEDLASDVLQLLIKLGVEKACFVGHNMGGRTAMYLALIEPKKVAGILIVDISPVSTPPELTVGLPKIMDAMKLVTFKDIKKISVAKREAKKQLKHLISDDVVMHAILKNFKRKSGSVAWNCNLEVLIRHFKYIASFPGSAKKRQYSGPTLFVGGQKSDFIPPDDLTEIRNMFPSAVIVYVPKTGHYLHVEDPKSFLELTIEFVRRIE